MNVCNGKILKGIGGFYYVKTENGVIECKACGKFRKKAFIPYVGDDVELNEEYSEGRYGNAMVTGNAFNAI